jgi:hypothetical protein
MLSSSAFEASRFGSLYVLAGKVSVSIAHRN